MNMKTSTLIKSVFLMVTLAISSSVNVQAQQRPPQSRQMQMPKVDPSKVMEEQLSWLTKNLKITEEQATKIKALQLTETEQRKEVLASGLTPRSEDFREKMQGIDTQRDEELSKILTAEQWKTFEKKKEEFMAIGRPARPTRD